MPIKRRLAAVARREPDPVSVFKWSHDGLDHPLGDPHYRTPQEAAVAWAAHRRVIWSQTHRFQIPGPAGVYDGLTLLGLDFVRSHWNGGGPFDLAGALAALDADRTALAAFRATRGARAIEDYLDLFSADLDVIERAARDLAAWPGEDWLRPYPGLSTASRYGDDGPPRSAAAER